MRSELNGKSYTAKVAGFSSSCIINESQEIISDPKSRMPAYMAPEIKSVLSPRQKGKHQQHPSADVYSFGVLTFECVTGRLPVSDDNFGDVNIEPELLELIVQCLNKHPDGRPDWEKIVEQLSGILFQQPKWLFLQLPHDTIERRCSLNSISEEDSNRGDDRTRLDMPPSTTPSRLRRVLSILRKKGQSVDVA